MFRGRGKKSLFARLAFCADCGKGMNYKNDREGYVCSTYQKEGSKNCASHFIKHILLKEIVLQDLQNLSTNALDCTSLVNSVLKKANIKMTQAKSELLKKKKMFKELREEQLELVRALTRKLFDDETFNMSNDTLKSEMNTLVAKINELEGVVSQEQENEGFMKKFQEEVNRFAELEISDEEILRDVLHRLIDKVEIAEDGSIAIYYNFINPLFIGA